MPQYPYHITPKDSPLSDPRQERLRRAMHRLDDFCAGDLAETFNDRDIDDALLSMLVTRARRRGRALPAIVHLVQGATALLDCIGGAGEPATIVN